MSFDQPILDVRTILIARHPDGHRVLLLKRSQDKKLFPGLITGIGGALEFSMGEEKDMTRAVLREVSEETAIGPDDLDSPALRLATLEARGQELVLLLWFTAGLKSVPDLSTAEGELAFYNPDALPLERMIPSARYAIPKVLAYPPADSTLHVELIPK
jgi:8-oxo-dGTP pyrophosphatase MutT (NUDIX family)